MIFFSACVCRLRFRGSHSFNISQYCNRKKASNEANKQVSEQKQASNGKQVKKMANLKNTVVVV